MGGVRIVLVICLCKVALTMVAQIISVSLPRMVTSSSGPNLAVQTDARCPREQRYLQQVIYEVGLFRCCEIKLCSEARDLHAGSFGHDLMLTACYPCPIHGYLPDWWKAVQACALISPVFYFFSMSIGGLLLCFGHRYQTFSIAGFCVCNAIAGILSIFSCSYATAKLTSEPQLILSGSPLFTPKYHLDFSNVHLVPDLGFYFSLIGGIISIATSGFFYIAAKHASKTASTTDILPTVSGNGNGKLDPTIYEIAACLRQQQQQQQHQQQQQQMQQGTLPPPPVALGNQAYCGSQAALVDLGFGGLSPNGTTKIR